MNVSRALALFLLSVSAIGAKTGVCLTVSSETVPAGGIAQVKVFLTEPKPIVRTSMAARYSSSFFGDVFGIAAGRGLSGVAKVGAGQLRIELSAFSKAGLDSDYPLLTFAVSTQPNLPKGATASVSLDFANSSWIGPSGQPYPETELKNGSVTIDGTMYVSNVIPGGGTLAPGETFRVTGAGFVKDMKARGDEVRLQSSTPNELVMVARKRAVLDGELLRFESKNHKVEYFSYVRAQKTRFSTHPALSGMVPVFSTNASLQSVADILRSPGTVTAIGLQNPTPNVQRLHVDALDARGQSLKSAIVELGPRQVTFRTAEEIFGGPMPAGSSSIQVQSTAAFQLSVAEVDTGGSGIRVPSVTNVRPASY